MKPTIIYVSGAPGSGKTTLAKIISKQLNIPHVSSDLIHGGVSLTDPLHDRGQTIHDVFVPHMIVTAKCGISFVVDHALQKDIAKDTIIDKLKSYANVIYIHVQTTDPITRYSSNIQTNESIDIQSRSELLLDRAKHHTRNLHNTIDKIELDIPTLVVNTNDGYSPDLHDIIGFVKSRVDFTQS